MTRSVDTPAVSVFDRPFSDSLHGLRGIASLTVFANHFINLLTANDPVLGPLHRFDGGLSSVALFFVMSGVVLGISLKRFTFEPVAYARYGVRRAFRLLPMVVVACTIGFAFTHLRWHAEASSAIFGDLYFRFYQDPLPLTGLLFSWTGLYAAADPPMWSIYVEIIGSALLPFFVLASRTGRGNVALCVGLLVLSLATSGADGHLARNHWPVYMVNFSVGLLLCHVGRDVSVAVNRLSRRSVALLTIGLYSLLMGGRTALHLGEHGDALGNLFDVAVSSVLVLLLLERRETPGAKWHLSFLGNISYPLYLLHWPVLCLVLTGSVRWLGTDLVAAHLDLWAGALFLSTLAVLLVLSLACHLWVEKPAMALGKRLTRSARPIRAAITTSDDAMLFSQKAANKRPS